jgi:dTDP-4-dehydrorhamnose reductase
VTPKESAFRVRRVMIVGASGYIGSALSLGLRDDFDVFAAYNNSPMWIEGVHGFKMDCLNANEILQSVQRYRPDLIVYSAGLAQAQVCQTHPMYAEALHSRAMTLFFKVLPRAIPFVYLSCDQVLAGSENDLSFRFTEDDDPNPCNELGQTKTRGESLVLQHSSLTYVMRIARVYGERLGSPHKPRESWVQRLLLQSEQGLKSTEVNNQWRSTVYVGDIVRALRKFFFHIPSNSGLFQIGASDAMTPLDMSKQTLGAWGYDPELISAASLESRIASLKCPEPIFSAMSSKRFESTFDFRFQPFPEGLKEMRSRLETGFTQSWI